MAIYKQRSFTGGELAPSLYARVDTVKYATGLRTLRNAFVQAHGGVSNRTGTKFVAEVKDSSKAVALVPFVFNADQTYILEFGNLYMRVHRNGAQVLVASKAITAITRASSAELTVTSHGYLDGEEIFISDIVGMNELNGRNFRVANQTANTFELTDLNGAAIDSTLFSAYLSAGSVAKVFELTTPYLEADLINIQYIQSADIITLVHPSYAPGELARLAHNNWTLNTIAFLPAIATPTTLAGSGGTGTPQNDYVVTAIAEESYEESLISNTTAQNIATSGTPVTLTWVAVAGAQEYNVYKKSNGVYGFIGVAGSNTFIDSGIDADTTKTPPSARNPFGSADNYPSSVAYIQQRLSFANTNNDPEKIWMSKSGNFKNFTISSPLQDDDAVTFTLAGRQVNEVRHLLDIGQMVIFTTAGVWVARGDQAGIIGPASIYPTQNSYNGSASLTPIVIEDTALYVQARGSIVRDLGQGLQVDKYSGSDLTIFSKHLVEGFTLVDWTYAATPSSIVWAIRNDGTFIGLTYVKEHQVSGWHRHDFASGFAENVKTIPAGNEDQVYFVVKRTINGVTKRYIEFSSSRLYPSIKEAIYMDATISYDGRNTTATTMTLSGGTDWTYEQELTLTASVGVFSAEDIGRSIHMTAGDGSFLRFAITAYTSTSVVSGKPDRTVKASLQNTPTVKWSKAIRSIANLHHLEGEKVSILADGFVVSSPNNPEYPTIVITNGVATLDKEYAVIHVGLPYVSDIETLDIDTAQGESIADMKKNISQVSLYLEKTRGIFVGPSAPSVDTVAAEAGLTELKMRNDEDYDSPVDLKTGIVEVNIRPEWNSNGRVFVRQVDPLPMTILAIYPEGNIPGMREA